VATAHTPVKCLVRDLDNTLWRGTLLEDGDVRVRDEVPEILAALDRRGILHSIAGRKPDAVRNVADHLRVAPATTAFIDDEPVERAEVAFALPDVRCYRADRIPELLNLPEFTALTITEDSGRRRQMYRAGFQRDAERETYQGLDDDFLRSLKITMRIARAEENDLARVEELTLRTSQMNATGVHYSDATLRELPQDPFHEVLTAAMHDRFGPYGAIGVSLVQRGSRHRHIICSPCPAEWSPWEPVPPF
jgi:methoxymalonate biosynthesis protein